MPDTGVAGQQKLVLDPAGNFGLFQSIGQSPKDAEHYLGVKDYSDVHGYGGSPLGWGVVTTVR